MSLREQILEQTRAVPALPSSATRILAMIQDPDASMSDIMDIIAVDPGLTTDFLRLANSAYFAGPRRISSLRDAGVLLGTARIQQLVIASAVFPLVMPPLKGYDLPPGELLDHMVAVAIGAEELAKALQRAAPPWTFTAGLLHDIGKIVLGTFVEVDCQPIVQLAFQQGVSFEEAERQVLGVDHAEVGADLLAQWQFPEDIVQVVRWHHQPEQMPGDPLVADLVHAADTLSVECGQATGVDGLNYRSSPGTVERLHLRTRVCEAVTCRMLTELQTLREQNILGRGGR
jgi:putative nucleotidyltransferase with HDIG domain